MYSLCLFHCKYSSTIRALFLPLYLSYDHSFSCLFFVDHFKAHTRTDFSNLLVWSAIQFIWERHCGEPDTSTNREDPLLHQGSFQQKYVSCSRLVVAPIKGVPHRILLHSGHRFESSSISWWNYPEKWWYFIGTRNYEVPFHRRPRNCISPPPWQSDEGGAEDRRRKIGSGEQSERRTVTPWAFINSCGNNENNERQNVFALYVRF